VGARRAAAPIRKRRIKKAAEAGLADRADFQVATVQGFPGTGYDLVTMFDRLHDMGDPPGATRRALAPDGTWLLVEPFASGKVEENFTPVGRLCDNGSTFLCVLNALSREGGYALGAQAGPAAIRELTTKAEFTHFRQVAQTAFDLVYEIRP